MDVHQDEIRRTIRRPPAPRGPRARAASRGLAVSSGREPWRWRRRAFRAAAVATHELDVALVAALALPFVMGALDAASVPPSPVMSVHPAAFVDGDGAPHAMVTVVGRVGKGAAARFADLVRDGLGRGDAVVLDVGGGSAEEALDMGRGVRSAGMRAVVASRSGDGSLRAGVCRGAYLLVLAGGADRVTVRGSSLGATSWSPSADGAHGDVVAHLTAMGVPTDVSGVVMADDGRALGTDAAVASGLVGAELP